MRRITSPLILSYKNQLYTIGVKPATSNREFVTVKKALYAGRRERGCYTDNQVCRVSMEWENNTRDRRLNHGRRTAASHCCGSLAVESLREGVDALRGRTNV